MEYIPLYNIGYNINDKGQDQAASDTSYNKIKNQEIKAKEDPKIAITPLNNEFFVEDSSFDCVIGDLDTSSLSSIYQPDNFKISNDERFIKNKSVTTREIFSLNYGGVDKTYDYNYLRNKNGKNNFYCFFGSPYEHICIATSNDIGLFPIRNNFVKIKLNDPIRILQSRTESALTTMLINGGTLQLISVRVLLQYDQFATDIVNTNKIFGFGYVFKYTTINDEEEFYYLEKRSTDKLKYFEINFPTSYSNRFCQVKLRNESDSLVALPGSSNKLYEQYMPINMQDVNKIIYRNPEEFREKFGSILLGINSQEETTQAEQEKELAVEQLNEVRAASGIINKADNLNAYKWDFINAKISFGSKKQIKLSAEDEIKIFNYSKTNNFEIINTTKESKEKGTELVRVKLNQIKCNIFKTNYFKKECYWVVLNPESDSTKKIKSFLKSKNGIIFTSNNNSLSLNKFYFDKAEEKEKNKFIIPYSTGSNTVTDLTVEAYGDEINFEIFCADQRSSDREFIKVTDVLYDKNKEYDKVESFFKYKIERLDSEKSEENDSTTGKSRAEIEDFIKSWSCKIDTGNPNEQYGYDIDRYYDMFSGMTPYIKLGFANKNIENNTVWNYIDSVYSPFIQSLSIKDNGVKTITLKLYDKDFASYNKLSFETIDSVCLHPNDKGRTDNIYSLEDLLRKSLKSENFGRGENAKRETYKNIDEQLIDEFLKIEKSQTNLIANLSIRFGYCDYNQPLTEIETKTDSKGNIKENSIKEDSSSDTLTDYFKKKGSTQRNNRWWNFTDTETKTYPITFEDKAIKDDKITHIGGKQINSKKSTTGIYRERQINSTIDQTTSMSQEIEFMITNFKTTLQNNGLLYEITAIEQKDCELIGNRFLQRFASIKSFPNDVLYMLMHIFNEKTNGDNVKSSNVKILLGLDEEYAKSFGYKLVEKIDTKKLANNKEMLELFDSDYLDTYNIKNEKDVSPDILEQITLSFGTESSFSNFIASSEKPPLYKSISSLISEFCSACPPKKKISVKPKIYNKDGEEVNVYDQNAVSAPLSFFTVKDQKENIVYVVLYYRNVRKPGIIRVYNWGVESPYMHCITSLSIENSNEFAILNGINCFSANDGKVRRRIGNINQKNGSNGAVNANSKEVDIESGKMVNQITYTTNASDSYDIAYSSSMYNGTIEILGDPFYVFDEYMQPCTYPILLNVLVPLNELAFTNEVEEWKKRKTVVKNGNQRLHELSGYYVIKEINHDISRSGFKTTLSVMSYPNIQNDVLVGKGLQMKQ